MYIFPQTKAGQQRWEKLRDRKRSLTHTSAGSACERKTNHPATLRVITQAPPSCAVIGCSSLKTPGFLQGFFQAAVN